MRQSSVRAAFEADCMTLLLALTGAAAVCTCCECNCSKTNPTPRETLFCHSPHQIAKLLTPIDRWGCQCHCLACPRYIPIWKLGAGERPKFLVLFINIFSCSGSSVSDLVTDWLTASWYVIKSLPEASLGTRIPFQHWKGYLVNHWKTGRGYEDRDERRFGVIFFQIIICLFFQSTNQTKPFLCYSDHSKNNTFSTNLEFCLLIRCDIGYFWDHFF